MRWIRKHRDRWRLPVVGGEVNRDNVSDFRITQSDVEAQQGDDREKKDAERIDLLKNLARSYREQFAAMTSRPPYWSDPLGEWFYFPSEIGAERAGVSEVEYLTALQVELNEGNVYAHPFLEDYYSEKVTQLYLDSVFSVHKTGQPQVWHDRT